MRAPAVGDGLVSTSHLQEVESPLGADADRIPATHRAESLSTQAAFAVEAADLGLGAGLGHALEEGPEWTHIHTQTEINRTMMGKADSPSSSELFYF